MKDDFQQMTAITQMHQDRALAEHRKSLAESRALADELAEIDARRAAMQADSGTVSARQLLGADALWQGWLIRRRSEILQRMALARARETETAAVARKALSRHDAVTGLAEAEAAKRRARLQDQALQRLDALSTLSRWR